MKMNFLLWIIIHTSMLSTLLAQQSWLFNTTHSIKSMLLMAQRANISTISLDTPALHTSKIPLKGINFKYGTNIDYDPIEKRIYWTDRTENTIQRAELNGNNQENVIQDLHYFEDIAVDWLARNIYFTDHVKRRIQVHRLNTKYRKSIIVDGIEYPKAVAVSPQHALVWWTDCGESSPKIERVNLDGSNRLILVKDRILCASSITLDCETSQLFWGDTDSRTIEVANMMNGENRRTIVEEEQWPIIWSITSLGDHLFWTNWNLKTFERINKSTDEDRTVLLANLPDAMAIKAINMSAEVQLTNPCYVSNGGCDQFCFYQPGGNAKCDCQLDYELKSDGKGCIIPNAFIVIRSVDKLRKISIRNSSINEIISMLDLNSVNAFDADVINSQTSVYLADNRFSMINRTFLNGLETETFIDFDIQSPISIQVDQVALNLYWIDGISKRIEVCSLRGKHRKVLFWKNLHNPSNLVLNYPAGAMCWSEWDGEMGTIFEGAMDGSSKRSLVVQFKQVNGLTIDYYKYSLYWWQSETDHSSIRRFDVIKGGVQVIVSGTLLKPTSLTIHENNLFWINRSNQSIIRADKLDGNNATLFYAQEKEIVDFSLVDSGFTEEFGEYSKCNECTNLCLLKPGRRRFKIVHSCACPTHYEMKNGNCYPPENFLFFSSNNTLHRLIDGNEYPDVPIPLAGMKETLAIEYDPITEYVYWIDGSDRTIKRSHVIRPQVEEVFGNGQNDASFNFYDLALDPYNQLLFWSCSLTNSINAIRLDKEFSLLGTVFIGVNRKPRKIAIHAKKALLFWTDDGLLPSIRRTQLGGQYIEHIDTDNRTVEAIAVDIEANLLFYSYDQMIFSCDLSGGNKTLIKQTSSSKIITLAVFNSFIYYGAEYKETPSTIEIIRKFPSDNTSRDAIQLKAQVTDLISVKSLSRSDLSSHPCDSVNHHPKCSHFCIRSKVNPDQTSCSCLANFKLNDDGITCSRHPTMVHDENHFRCDEKAEQQILNSKRCDGIFDCQNGADEENCLICTEHQFRCLNRQCVDWSEVCDGRRDCFDGSDENCCSENQFQCVADSKCIPKLNFCDGVKNCDDGSDEVCRSSDDWGDYFYIVAPSIILFLIFLIVYVIWTKKKYCNRNKSIGEQVHEEMMLRPENKYSLKDTSNQSQQAETSPSSMALIKKQHQNSSDM